jgi:aminoglycoside phosphotransferase (APT) family kinase protein
LPSSGYYLPDDLLRQTAELIRLLHDVTAGLVLANGHEIVAHHELGPYNTIFRAGKPVGLIDWDDAAPGTWLRDFANAVWCYVDVGQRAWPVDDEARRIHLMCAAYGWDDPLAIVNDNEADLQQALRNHEQAGRAGAAPSYDKAWRNSAACGKVARSPGLGPGTLCRRREVVASVARRAYLVTRSRCHHEASGPARRAHSNHQ